MFGKYLWHELKNTFKLPLIISLISVGTLSIVFMSYAIKSPLLVTLSSVLVVGSLYAMSVIAVLTVIFTYSGRLFNSKGYLTLTMPIKTTTIIWAKTLAVFIYLLGFAILAFILLISFLFVGVTNGGIVNIFALFGSSVEELKTIPVNLILALLIMIFVVAPIMIFAFLMIFLFILAFSKTGTKKGIVVVTIIGIILGTLILTSIVPNLGFPNLYYCNSTNSFIVTNIAGLDAYSDLYIEETGYFLNATKLFNFFNLIYYIGIGVTLYFVNHYIMKNKLDIR